MLESKLTVVRYDESMSEKWDNFIEASVNGTFLQSRRFLSYHKDRFEDYSILFYRKNELVAVCPAEITADGVFFSHKGSTFGGLIFTKKEYGSVRTLEAIAALVEYVREAGFNQVVLKITPDLFSKKSSALLEYCLLHEGFVETTELSTYIDFSVYQEDIVLNFNYSHRREKRIYDTRGAQFRKILSAEEIGMFHAILSDNLKKHNAVPVHTVSELLELKYERLTDETEFYGVFINEEMIAGTMIFYFKYANVAHTQYLAARHALDGVSPMSFLYANILEEVRRQGYGKLSWGIATENDGEKLNNGLIWFKESVGSLHSLNRTFKLDLRRGV